MYLQFFLKNIHSVLLFLIFSTLSACGSDYNWNDTGTSSGLKIEVAQPPQVTWLDSNGKTQVIVQFSARDKADNPLTEDQLEVTLNIDNKPIDVESLLNQTATDLAVNIYFAMVLDASYSMTQHSPPAFEPMLKAARDSYQEVLDLWSTRPGNVKFSLVWFDELMNQSKYNINLASDWKPDDILTIPEPTSGTATKLYSAVKVMSNHLQAEYDNGVFNGPRDQYVMLVFSDGADNYSYWDNSAVNTELNTTSGASYQQFGTVPSTLDDALQSVSAHPRLTTHVIGLGSAINESELTQIAKAGNGTYQANPKSDNIAELFDRVLKQFTTVQTRGAEIPLPPGDYEFTLSVKNKSNGAKSSYSFMMHAGDPEAGLLSTP